MGLGSETFSTGTPRILSCFILTAVQTAATAAVSPTPATPSDADTPEIEANKKVVEQLCSLEFELSVMLTTIRKLHFEDCDISQAVFFLNDLSGTEDFASCVTIEQIIKTLRRGYIDTFNVYLLEKVADCLKSGDMKRLAKEYEEKKERLFKETTVVDFQRAVVSKVKPALSKRKVEVTIKVQKRLANERVLKDMEQLAAEAFDDNQKWFVHFHAIPGSVIVLWHVPESLSDTLEQLVHSKVAMLREEGVEEVTIGGKTVFLSTQEKVQT